MSSEPSRAERSSLLVATGFASIVSLADILVLTFHDIVHPPEVDFGLSGIRPGHFLLGHFLTLGLLAVTFVTRRRYVGAFLYSLLCFTPFMVELAKSYHILYHHDLIYTQSFLSILNLIGNPFDFLIAMVLPLIALWLLSLAIRPLVKIESDSR